jgi:multisubunit Na+/H+ antiporter MnhC subunit
MIDTLHIIITIGSFIIFGIGFVGVVLKKNLFLIFISLSITEASLFLFFIGMHFDETKTAPIITNNIKEFTSTMTDPVPQAMILTTIVIAIAILALALSFIVNYQKLTKNLDINKMDEFTEKCNAFGDEK